MKGNALPLAEHIDKALRKYHFGIPMTAAFVAAISFGVFALLVQASSGRVLLGAISAHVSTLLETNDRPELQRLIKSIAEERKSRITVVQDSIVVAASNSLSELDRPYSEPHSFLLPLNIFITSSSTMTKTKVTRSNGPRDFDAVMVIESPLEVILKSCIFVAGLVFVLGVWASRIYGYARTKTISTALLPVKQLDQAIRELRTLKDPSVLTPTGIQELENIREGLLETHQVLLATRDELAQSKAKELTAKAYASLIHDLHSPVSALGNLIKVMNEGEDEATRHQATQKISKIASQILTQVTVAKSNLALESAVLSSVDIRESIQEGVDQAIQASEKGRMILVSSQLPDVPLVVPHDLGQLRRAVANLVGNAIEASKTKVEVALERVDSEVHIRVMDDGPGLTQEAAGIFLQGRGRSTKENRPALGLAGTNHIVRSHGGRIIYRPSVMGGACFEIRIKNAAS